MNVLFLMKPLEIINPQKDTSLLFMQAAQRLGHAIYYLAQGGVSITPEGLRFNVRALRCTESLNQPFEYLEDTVLNDSEVDAVFVRTDPPFDDAYLHDMWLLDRLPDRVRCINSAHGIKTVNEKIWLTQFRQLIPKTWITTSRTYLEEVLDKEGSLILKPTQGFGGRSIYHLKAVDINRAVILDALFEHGYVIAQEVLSEATKGDKRILLCDGEPLGAILRVHPEHDHRNNLDAGGHAEKAVITARDREIIAQLKPHLISLGLRFVGIDIIGDYLIEVNVTSPTCLQELNHLESQRFEDSCMRVFLG